MNINRSRQPLPKTKQNTPGSSESQPLSSFHFLVPLGVFVKFKARLPIERSTKNSPITSNWQELATNEMYGYNEQPCCNLEQVITINTDR